MPRKTPIERFNTKYIINPETNCWEWTDYINQGGYGRFSIMSKEVLAHRFSYENFVGPIPDGMHVCHTCDNRCCVNFSHLFLGTHQDNMDDRERKGRGARNIIPIHIGETNGNSVLKESDVVCIRETYARGGITQKQLGHQFGVSNQLISEIIRHTIWKHI